MLRGDAKPGVNSYLPLPTFDKRRHMAFRDWEAWNAKCAVLNEKYAETINFSFARQKADA